MWEARIAGLELLADLREQNSISEEVFETRKRQLLAGGRASVTTAEAQRQDHVQRSANAQWVIKVLHSLTRYSTQVFEYAAEIISNATGRTLAIMSVTGLIAMLMIWNLLIEPTYVWLFRPSTSQITQAEYNSACSASFSACEGKFVAWTGQVASTGSSMHVEAGDVRLKLPGVDGTKRGFVEGQRVRFSGYLEEGGLFSRNQLDYPEVEPLETPAATRARAAAADAAYERKLEREFDKARPNWGTCYVLSQGNSAVAAECERKLGQPR